MTKVSSQNKPKQIDGLEKLRSYRLANHDDEEAVVAKRWRAVLKMGLLFVVCAVLIYGAKLIQLAWQHINEQKLLNATTAQVSQLVDNIRQFYALNGNQNDFAAAYLRQFGPADGKIINPYGGDIIITSSTPIKNADGMTNNTFKLSLQGLPRLSCVALAGVNWGTSAQGLQAVAVGSVDGNGYDKALFDIDDTSNQIKTIQLQDKNGNWQNISLPPQYKRNVARTKANNSAEPQMSENAAVYGCDCGNEKRCSLALRYTF